MAVGVANPRPGSARQILGEASSVAADEWAVGLWPSLKSVPSALSSEARLSAWDIILALQINWCSSFLSSPAPP